MVGVTLAGGNVDIWNDQSGNGYHLTDLAGFRPGFSATAWNGANPGVTNSPAGLLEQTGGLASYLSGTPNLSMVCSVTTAPTDGGLRVVCSWRNDPALDDPLVLGVQNKTGSPFNDAIVRMHSQTDNVEDGVDTAEGRHTIGYTLSSGGAVKLYVDGVETASDTLTETFATANQFLMLCDHFGGSNWLGVVSEVVIYSAVLSGANVSAYHTYAASKWGGM